MSIYWKNTPENRVKCLSFVSQAEHAIMQREAFYLHKYGVVPLFKTGIHAGDVTAGYIGIIKKELVFSGDTLNTTARIRSMCHTMGHSHVMSGHFLNDVANNHQFVITEIGEIELKGREEKEKLYALRLSAL